MHLKRLQNRQRFRELAGDTPILSAKLSEQQPDEDVVSEGGLIVVSKANSGAYRRQLICPHQGAPRTDKQGVTMKVSCGCTGAEREVKMAIHGCALHSRCLPNAKLNAKQLQTWRERHESSLYQLCQICPDGPAQRPPPPTTAPTN